MKPVNETLEAHLPPVTLFREDFEKIASLAEGHCRYVHVEADGFEYDSIAEFLERAPERVRNVKVKAASPYVSLGKSAGHTWIHVPENGPVAAGLFHHFTAVARARARGPALLYQLRYPFGVFFLLWSISGALDVPKVAAIIGPYIEKLSGPLLVATALSCVWVLFIYISARAPVRAFPRRRYRDQGFASLHRDAIALIGALAAVAGTLIGAVSLWPVVRSFV